MIGSEHVPDPSFVPAPACHVRDAKPRPPRVLEFKVPCCENKYGRRANMEPGLVEELAAEHMRNCAVFRNDVTIRTCPGLLVGDVKVGDPNTTHHLIPCRVGTMRGEPVFEHRCRGCGQKVVHLKSDSKIEAAITLFIDHVKAGA